MPTETDSDKTPQGAVSIRVERGRSWRAHVPTAVLIALVTALNGGTCTKADEVARKLDELNTRVSRIEGALGVRTASAGPNDGAQGAGGTGSGTAL